MYNVDISKFETIKRRVRIILVFFLVGFVISGLTAFPIRWEIAQLQRLIGANTFMEGLYSPMAHWISYVHRGLTNINQEQIFILCLHSHRYSVLGPVARPCQEYLDYRMGYDSIRSGYSFDFYFCSN